MIYGLRSGERALASPGERASCPTCSGDLVAKCGKIVAWHWAHEAKDCDPWSEGESAWHLDWKELAPPERREVVRGPHRADLVGPGGGVIELQHSSISVDEIEERERFYGKMVWVFDASGFARNMHFRARAEYVSFRWLWPRKSLLAVTRPIFFDFGNGHLLEVRKLGDDVPLGGWGYHRSQRWFAEKFLGVSEGADITPDNISLGQWAHHARCVGCSGSFPLALTSAVADQSGCEIGRMCSTCASFLEEEEGVA